MAFLSIAFSKYSQQTIAFQIALMHAVNQVIITYYALARPLVNRRVMNMSIMNEFLVSVSITLLVCFTDYVPKQET